MPLYEYECKQCGTKTEVIRPLTKMDEPEFCPACDWVMDRVTFPGCSVYIETIGQLYE